MVAAFALAACSAAAAAQEEAVYQSPGRHLSLTPHVHYLFDPAGAMAADDAMAAYREGRFAPASAEWLELGVREGVAWLAFTLINQSGDPRLVLEVRNPRMSYVDLYVPDGQGGFRIQQNGAARSYEMRTLRHPMPSFPIRLESGAAETYLIRIESLGDFRLRLWLWDAQAFLSHASGAYAPELIMLGLLLALSIYHFLVFLSLRESSYLHLSIFIAMWMLFHMAGTGLGSMLLWGESPWLAMRANTLFFVLMCVSFICFTISFLESRRTTPVLARAAVGAIGLLLVYLAFVVATDSASRIYMNRAMGLGSMALVAALVWGAWRKGSAMAPLFALSWAFVLLGAGLMLLLSLGAVPGGWLMGSPLLSLLFAASILLWSFELTGRIKVRAKEQRELLEKEVRERTGALEQAIREVKTLSGLLPICSNCKSIRDDTGYWSTVEHYIMQRTEADFTHGICPSCVKSLYPELLAQNPRLGANDPAE